MSVGLGIGMRLILLCVTFLTLVATLLFCWQRRFGQVAAIGQFALEDLVRGVELPRQALLTGEKQDLTLRLEAHASGQGNSLRLHFPGVPPSAGVFLSFRLVAQNLQPGNETWQNGRAIIEWHKPGRAGDWENDAVASVRFDDVSRVDGVVIHPGSAPSVPALRLEHLGKSGTMSLSDFRAQVIGESAWWRIGKWGLLCGFLGWSYALIRSFHGIHPVAALGAAAIWVAMGWHLAVPGPWKIQRPLIQPFEIGDSDASASLRTTATTPTDLSAPVALPPSGATRSSGDIPLQGSLPLRVKFLITSARPLLHILLFAVPAFLMTALTGRLPALCLCSLLALLVECSQWAFGYGFGVDDVGDILTDTTGIVVGILACLWCWNRAKHSRWEPLRSFGKCSI
jgi:hypothetical protein